MKSSVTRTEWFAFWKKIEARDFLLERARACA